MKLSRPLSGLSIGVGICLLSILRIIYVRKAWEHTTFHPGYEMDTPFLFLFAGAIISAGSCIAALVLWLRRCTAAKKATQWKGVAARYVRRPHDYVSVSIVVRGDGGSGLHR